MNLRLLVIFLFAAAFLLNFVPLGTAYERESWKARHDVTTLAQWQIAALDGVDTEAPLLDLPPSLESAEQRQLEKQELIETISKLRRAARQQAERQLDADPKIQKLRLTRRVPKPLGEAYTMCIETPTTMCLLQESLAYGYRVSDQERRDWILADIARLYTQIGAYSEAQSITVLADDPRYALRIADAINTALASNAGAIDQAPTSLPANAPNASLALAQQAEEAFRIGDHDAGMALLKEAATARARLESTYARSYSEHQAAQAYLIAYQNSPHETYFQKISALAEQNRQAQLAALTLLRLTTLLEGQKRSAIQDMAETKIEEIASDVRRVFFLTGLEQGDAPKAFLKTSWERALHISDRLTHPWARARAFLRLAQTAEEKQTP